MRETSFSEERKAKMSVEKNSYDAVVVGAGLSGLFAGLHLQKNGFKTLIVEKRKSAGGLCGTYFLDDYEFVIAANDFGRSLKQNIADLGLKIPLKKAKTQFYFETDLFTFPPDLKTLGNLLPGLADLIRFFKAPQHDLESAVKKNVKNAKIAQFLLSLAYPLGIPPKDVRMASLKLDFGHFIR
jgi:protoporphyrinogen oxidase